MVLSFILLIDLFEFIIFESWLLSHRIDRTFPGPPIEAVGLNQTKKVALYSFVAALPGSAAISAQVGVVFTYRLLTSNNGEMCRGSKRFGLDRDGTPDVKNRIDTRRQTVYMIFDVQGIDRH